MRLWYNHIMTGWRKAFSKRRLFKRRGNAKFIDNNDGNRFCFLRDNLCFLFADSTREKVSMNTFIDNKKFHPIAIFTAMLACVNVLKGEKIFTFIALMTIFLFGFLMAMNIYNDKEHRVKNSIIEFVYVIVIYFTIRYMPVYIRAFYSVVLVIIEFSVYVLYVNPTFMNRKLVYRIK